MRIFLSANTVGRYGGGLNGQLRYLPQVIEDEFRTSDFNSTFEQFWLTLSYPPMYILPGILSLKDTFDNYYTNSLPYSRLGRKTKKIEINLRAPEFSEHFNNKKKDDHDHQFDIEDTYKNLTETDLAKIVIDKLIEAGTIIRSKLKKEDVFEIDKYNTVLIQLKEKITNDFLKSTYETYSKKAYEETLRKAITLRDQRNQEEKPKDKLIRDIRVYATGLPEKALYPYDNEFSELFLTHLREHKFHCPKYTHLYVQVAQTMEDALIRSLPYEDWYVNGIATINYDDYVKQSESEKKKNVFDIVLAGLKDIAFIDKLDTNLIDIAANTIRKTEFK